MAIPGKWLPNGRGGWYIVDSRGVAQPARRHAAELFLEGKPIPPRPPEAEGFRLFTDWQRVILKSFKNGEFQSMGFGEMVRKLSQTLAMVGAKGVISSDRYKGKEKESGVS